MRFLAVPVRAVCFLRRFSAVPVRAVRFLRFRFVSRASCKCSLLFIITISYSPAKADKSEVGRKLGAARVAG